MKKKIKSALLQCAAASLVVTFAAGCSEQTEPKQVNATVANQVDYAKKMAILDQAESPQTPLGRMTDLLISEWPTLFTAKDEEELFQRYAMLTWNPTEKNKQNLRANLNQHPEYKNYQELYKTDKLPAQSVTVKELTTTLQDPELKTYNVRVTYSLLHQDGTVEELPLELQVGNQQLDVMNSRFNTDGDVTDGTLPDPADEQSQMKQAFMMRLLKEVSWRLNNEQMTELLK